MFKTVETVLLQEMDVGASLAVRPRLAETIRKWQIQYNRFGTEGCTLLRGVQAVRQVWTNRPPITDTLEMQ